MSMDPPETDNDWLRLEMYARSLFSAAPLSPVGAGLHLPADGLYPGRASEVRLMLRVVQDSARHILLYGERGLGKTSLANTFWRSVNTSDHPLVIARVQAYPFDDFSSLWSRALAELKTALEFKTTLKSYRNEAWSDSDQVSPDVVRRKFQEHSSNRMNTIIIIDEFDLLQIRETRQLTTNLLKSLHDYSINVTVILIGIAENVDELIVDHHSLRRVLSLVKLERMNTIDLNAILDNRIHLTPLELSDDARSWIVTLSCGLPYYCQILGKLATENAITRRRLRVQLEDVYAAIDGFLVESGQLFADDYQRAVDSRKEGHIFQEIILASALAVSDGAGWFKPSEVPRALELILPNSNERFSRIQQYLVQLASDRRGNILVRRGTRPHHSYRFSDALMQPFIIMRAIKEGMIEEALQQTLFYAGRRQFRDSGYRLGLAEAYAAQLGMISPTVMEKSGDDGNPDGALAAGEPAPLSQP